MLNYFKELITGLVFGRSIIYITRTVLGYIVYYSIGDMHQTYVNKDKICIFIYLLIRCFKLSEIFTHFEADEIKQNVSNKYKY